MINWVKVRNKYADGSLSLFEICLYAVKSKI